MSTLRRVNSSAATLTKNRTEGSIVPASGMCVTCVDGCIGMCEIGKSAYRGHEVIYPAAVRRHHHRLRRRSTRSTTRTSTSWARRRRRPRHRGRQRQGHLPHREPRGRVRPRQGDQVPLPLDHPGHRLDQHRQEQLGRPGHRLGPGRHRPDHRRERGRAWIPRRSFKNGRVVDTVDLKRRVKLYKDHQRDGYGAIIVQANVEDTRLGVQEYAIEKLGVEMRRAEVGPGRQGHRRRGQDPRPEEGPDCCYERGYVVLPNPTDPERHQGLRAAAPSRSSSGTPASAW